jgi:ABC-type uncharacterized transport system involved in gliding motility auxiliary subunit/ABC-type transport system involved in multi-copper enzyme maturation permease subunit
MSRVHTVARREVAGFFDQATAYILLIAFLSLGLFLTFRTIYAAGIATMRPFFDLLPWLFAIFIPAMTMRSLAEERRSGTLEWLMAQPLREPDVVLGKFLGNWIFALIALAGALPSAVGVWMASEADPGIMVAQFVGGALLAAQGVAIGMWASSLTRNQITSFILATAITFALILIGTPVVGVGLPPSIAAAVTSLSVVSHFENVARGVIDLRDLIYFVSTAGLFLVLATAQLSRERLSGERGGYSRLRTGTLTLIAAVTVLNLLGSKIRGRLDLTQGDLYTLSDGSREILSGLDDLVTLKLVISSELPPELQPMLRDVRDLVADLSRAGGGRLVVEEIDPDDGPEAETEAQNAGVQPTEFNVLRDDAFEVRQGWFGLSLLYADQTEPFPYIARTDDLEFRLVSAILRMTTVERPSAAFLSGFGAKEAFTYPVLQQQLSERFDLESINLQDTIPATIDPESVDVVILAGPAQPLGPEAVAAITTYVKSGGPALLLLDGNQIQPQMPISAAVSSGLEGFISELGVEIRDGMVMDWASNTNVSMGRQGPFNVVRPYPLWPVTLPAADHAVTRNLTNVSEGWASAFTVTAPEKVTPLLVSSEAGQLQASGGLILPDNLGEPDETALETLTLAVAVDGGEESTVGRVVIVGDANFLENQFVQGNPQNVAFAANAIDWLTQDEALISIRSKTRTPPRLAFTSDFQRSALKWGSLAGVPLLFILFGVARVTGRRARLERRWEEFTS